MTGVKMKKKITAIIILIALIFTACSNLSNQELYDAATEGLEYILSDQSSSTSNEIIENEGMVVEFLDVGQGDSILITLATGEVMLIDTGTDSADVLSMLQKRGVEKIDVMILTHMHEDHIGGADEIINEIDTDILYMPQIGYNSQAYQNLENAVNQSDIKVKYTFAGDYFVLGNATVEILSPMVEMTAYEEQNNFSVVAMVSYGDIDYLMTGDAEMLNEEQMINSGCSLDAEVLKVGHHGSRYSSSYQFLEAVSPEYAIISCGEDNQYGHPHQETIEMLESFEIKTFITQEQGTITIGTDGENIEVYTKY
jgi:competence protein ComEC